MKKKVGAKLVDVFSAVTDANNAAMGITKEPPVDHYPIPMSFQDYHNAADSTAIYPGRGNNLQYPALGLCGEAGEVAENVKKLMRDDHGNLSNERRDALIKELGDVMWYIAALCTELDISMEYVARKNADKLADRAKRGVLKGSGDNR